MSISAASFANQGSPAVPFGSPTLVPTATDVHGTVTSPSTESFQDRRSSAGDTDGVERRQFGSSHSELSPEAKELATAIDRYKLEYRRRYITCEEMLAVVKSLGYHRED